MNEKMTVTLKPYIQYKFINSVFGGLSTGAVFVIYGILKPSVFSIGGLILSLGILLVAKYYNFLMRMRAYFWTTVLTEIIVLIAMLLVLLIPRGEFLALAYYSLFNLIFIFGTYLMRYESNLFKNSKALMAIDSAKQTGNLLGLALSWMFYESLRIFNPASAENQSWDQVYKLHWILVGVQLLTLLACLRSFKKS